MTIAGVAIVVSASVAWGINKYQAIKRKNEEILIAAISLHVEKEALQKSLSTYAETYSLEEPDSELIERFKNKIKDIFRGNIENEFLKRETVEEKRLFAQQVIYELINSIGVKVDNIEFVHEELKGAFGETGSSNGIVTVRLDEVLLVDDPIQLIKTACHELKHCVQIQTITNNVWGYSPQRVAEYLYSWQNYVSPTSLECIEAYEKQIIEIDANKFVDAVFDL